MRQVANFTVEILKINEVTNKIYQEIKEETADKSLYSKEQAQQVIENLELPEDIFEMLTKKEIRDFNNLAKTQFEIWGQQEDNEQAEQGEQHEETPVDYNDYSQGHSQGYIQGQSEGYTRGYYAGYDEGYQDGGKDKELDWRDNHE